MRLFGCAGLVLVTALRLAGQAAPPSSPARALADRVQSSRLSRTVDRLVAFHTRHTLSDPVSGTRGIGAAQNWLMGELQDLTRLAGSRLVAFEDRFQVTPGPDLPAGAELDNLGVVLPGTDPGRVREALVLVAHYDSRASDPRDAMHDAPGAVDNASGVALVLEAAHVLAAEKPAISVYFVATAAGEQGQLGSQRLLDRLKGQGTEVVGMIAADSVGNVLGMDGAKNDKAARIFSDSVPAQETEGQRRVRELLGTENDGPSRELARYLRRCSERYVDDLDCLVMLRRERLGYRGEQAPFAQAGIPAVRITELVDNFDRLRQDVRPGTTHSYGDTASFFDPGYCVRITRVVVAALHNLAGAPAAPGNVGLSGAGTPNTRLWWTLPEDTRVRNVVIYRRRADGVLWQQTRVFPKGETVTLTGVGPDNDLFAVATVDDQGNESLPVTPRSVDF